MYAARMCRYPLETRYRRTRGADQAQEEAPCRSARRPGRTIVS